MIKLFESILANIKRVDEETSIEMAKTSLTDSDKLKIDNFFNDQADDPFSPET
jgi:hypothetical protein